MRERESSLAKLAGSRESMEVETRPVRLHRHTSSRGQSAPAEAFIRRNIQNGPDAIIVLKEERVGFIVSNDSFPSRFHSLSKMPGK